jgi:hypothetical protein
MEIQANMPNFDAALARSGISLSKLDVGTGNAHDAGRGIPGKDDNNTKTKMDSAICTDTTATWVRLMASLLNHVRLLA